MRQKNTRQKKTLKNFNSYQNRLFIRAPAAEKSACEIREMTPSAKY